MSGYSSVVGTQGGLIYHVASDGSLAWSYDAGAEIWAVVLDRNGYIYFGDLSGNVSKILIGATATEWSVSVPAPIPSNALAVDGDGHVYVGTAAPDSRVRKISPNGIEISSGTDWPYAGFRHDFGRVTDIEIDAHGYVYATANSREVAKIGPDGTEIWRVAPLASGADIPTLAIGPNRELYAGSASPDHRIYRLDPDTGATLATVDIGRDQAILGLYVSVDALRLVAGDDAGYVYVYDLDLTLATSWRSGITSIQGIVFDPIGSIYATGVGAGVEKYTQAGTLQWSTDIGSDGIDLTTYLPTPITPSLDDPARVHFSEQIQGVFVDATLEAAFFPLVDLPLGTEYSLGDELKPADPLYAFRIVERQIGDGLVAYKGQTILSDLALEKPKNSLVLVPGIDGVPNPLTPQYALQAFLDHYQVPHEAPLPPLYLRGPDAVIEPSLDAFVIQPDQTNPKSLYQWLEDLFAPFAGYTFRANSSNRLTVNYPFWVDLLGFYISIGYSAPLFMDPLGHASTISWIHNAAPSVEVRWDLFGGGSGSETHVLESGTPYTFMQSTATGDAYVTATWDSTAQTISFSATRSSLMVFFQANVTAKQDPASALGDFLYLTDEDLDPSEVQTVSSDSVVNQATVRSKGYTFQTGQPIMEPAAAVIRAPRGTIANISQSVIGPATAPTAADIGAGFATIVDQTAIEELAFWPMSSTVVRQPGSVISLSLEVEEWAEKVDGLNNIEIAAAIIETHTDTYDLPTDGQEYKVADLRYNWNTGGVEIYSGSGSIYARWEGGENAGIYLRVHTPSPFGSEWGIGGQRWFVWGAVIRANGSGTTYTESASETVARFGYTQADSGTWEGETPLSGLAKSQNLYAKRERTISAGIYAVPFDVALQMARSIVEVSYLPTAVRTLIITPRNPVGNDGGYRARPAHMGRRAILPDGTQGEIRKWEYSENHIGSSSSSVTIEVHSPAADQVARLGKGSRMYGTAAYGVGKYVEGA